MRRRELISLMGGAAAWPVVARAQEGKRVRRVGVLATKESARNTQLFVERLSKFGWVDGQNIHIDYRPFNPNPESARAVAAELVALNPDVIFAVGLGLVIARAQTKTIPIVFTQIAAPVERGLINSLARPDGNITGFTNFEVSVAGKWLGLLKEVAPKLVRSSTLYNPEVAPHARPFLQSVETASRDLGMETVAAPIHTDAEIEAAVASLGRGGDGALLVVPDPFTLVHRRVIIDAAATHRVPAIYPYQVFADDGGLMAYNDDVAEEFLGAAAYVDRILKGAKPGNLPVQAPTKYELVINRKTANSLGIALSPALLARADMVIE